MVVDRILKIIELKKINKNIFYKNTGLSNGFLDKVKDIGVSKIERILKAYPDVNPIWLLIGEGGIFKNEVLEEISDPASQKISLLEEKISLLEKNIITLEAQIKDKQEKEVLYQEKIRFLEGSVNNPIYTNMSNIGVQKKL